MVTTSRISHVDGLRGIAILLVVGYHYFPKILPGGFAGVDVFFVVSGYVIHRSISTLDRYSFREFYTRRAIRIFPALTIVAFLVILFSKYFYLDYPLRILLNSAIASSLFATNYYFISTSNYFDLESISKPLLTLWSLAVEEQFYLLWPIIFWAFLKRYKLLLTGLILFSFVSAIYFGIRSESFNFFSLQTRFWEIALGIYISTLKIEKYTAVYRHARRILVGGLIPFVLIDFGAKNWPNFITLLVVIGTALVILCPGIFLSRFLSFPIILFFGRISFPLYLVHWPLLSFYNNMKPANLPIIDKLVLMIISITFAFLIHKLIEKPIQRLKGNQRTFTAIFLSLTLISTGAFALSVRANLPNDSQIIRQSISSESVVVKRNSWYFSGRSELPQPKFNYLCNPGVELDLVFACKSGFNWNSIDALVIGDSKAEILFRALVRENSEGNWGFVGGGLNPVIPLAEKPLESSNWKSDSEKLVDWLANQDRVKRVVIVSATRNLYSIKSVESLDGIRNAKNFKLVEDNFIRWLKPLSYSNKEVFIVRDNPTLRDPTYCHGLYSAFSQLDRFTQVAENIQGCFYPLDQFQRDTSPYRDLLTMVARNYQSVRIIDPTDFFCDKSLNRCDLFKDKKLLYSYADHMSDFAADYVAKKVLNSANVVSFRYVQ